MELYSILTSIAVFVVFFGIALKDTDKKNVWRKEKG
jgi:hypothetical protein